MMMNRKVLTAAVSFFGIEFSDVSLEPSVDIPIPETSKNSEENFTIQEPSDSEFETLNNTEDIIGETEINRAPNQENDPWLWREFSNVEVEYWLSCGPNDCQNHNSPFEKSRRTYGSTSRYCHEKVFIGRKPNGENYKREWLLYSSSTGSLYCFRVIAVIRTLAERGLPFRGAVEKFRCSQNGNFLALLELISQFDPFLAAHITKYGNTGKGNVSYLSKTIYEELIMIMAQKVHGKIISQIKDSRYYSLSVDSTPDLTHMDQLSVVIRYIKDGQPVERFLTFIELKTHHTGDKLAKQTLQYLEEHCGLDFSKCRDQSYDEASNMSGRYNGMQQKILETYNKIIDALDVISVDDMHKGETRREAANLSNKLQELEFVLMLVIWDEILQTFRKVNKVLQDPEVTLETCANLYKSLVDFLRKLRCDFDSLEARAKEKLSDVEYKDTRQRRRKKMPNDGSAPEVECLDEDIQTYVRHLIALHDDFKFSFEDILSMEIPPWIIKPFGETEVENVILQEELLKLSTNEELKLTFKREYQKFWLQEEISEK
ncbi:Zinc finger MYM-type protein 1 [Eumeta japonica]|uniref:Zinc finger MYM-type protein 1 n=1 Tax=Eumeta variegata TaxID=151549 RepID=A0A4C1TDI8_EUMVA|nr:Zinc finger MYM-type protein 1 [Eumeta japonica]